jgi:hypothetical protein
MSLKWLLPLFILNISTLKALLGACINLGKLASPKLSRFLVPEYNPDSDLKLIPI